MNESMNEVLQEVSKIIDSLKGFDTKATGIVGLVAVAFCICAVAIKD